MTVLKGVIGVIILFLGRELNFLFAAGMAALLAVRLTPKLPATFPPRADYIFIAVVAILAAILVLTNERVGYTVSGFLAGGYIFVDYYAPNTLTVPLLPFLAGGVIGGIIVGALTEWALIIISSLIGAVYAITLVNFSRTAEILIAGGLFVIGGITQVIIMRMQKK